MTTPGVQWDRRTARLLNSLELAVAEHKRTSICRATQEGKLYAEPARTLLEAIKPGQ